MPDDHVGKATVEEDFVVCALIMADTAVIRAATPEAAAERYEMPEELAGKDVLLWAIGAEEFRATVAAAQSGTVIAAAEEALRIDGCNLRGELPPCGSGVLPCGCLPPCKGHNEQSPY